MMRVRFDGVFLCQRSHTALSLPVLLLRWRLHLLYLLIYDLSFIYYKDTKEIEVVVRRQSWELEGGGMDMDLRTQPLEVEFDVAFFCPVEHPVEPRDEDRPVKCPMFISSNSSIHDGKGNQERVAEESSQKISEQTTVVNNAMTAEPPVRAVRKRHHRLTRDNHIMAEPHIGKPSLLPIPPQTLTISQMLKQFDQV